jgi:hypothetical protein
MKGIEMIAFTAVKFGLRRDILKALGSSIEPRASGKLFLKEASAVRDMQLHRASKVHAWLVGSRCDLGFAPPQQAIASHCDPFRKGYACCLF